MEKILLLVKDVCNAYVNVGESRSYLANFSKRKEVTADTQEITCGQIAAKVQELVDAVNSILEGQNNG